MTFSHRLAPAADSLKQIGKGVIPSTLLKYCCLLYIIIPHMSRKILNFFLTFSVFYSTVRKQFLHRRVNPSAAALPRVISR